MMPSGANSGPCGRRGSRRRCRRGWWVPQGVLPSGTSAKSMPMCDFSQILSMPMREMAAMGVTDLRCEPGDIVEDRIGHRVQDLVVSQRFEPQSFVFYKKCIHFQSRW